MAMLVQCPNPACKASCSVAEANSGGPVRCPKCDKPFVVKPTVDAQKGDTNKHPPSSNVNPFPVLPAEFGRYRILKLLGRGGMGAVYLAQDTQLGRQVALKVPFIDASASPQRAERFVREARSAAVLQHPNICTVFDAGQIDGRPFITMAYIAGTPLEDEIDPEAPMPQLRAAEIVRKIALALEHAHRRGIVHRDLKPANVMMAAGDEPVVMDFGLAKRIADADPNQAKLTHFGTLLGTASYMSPEQVKGDVSAVGPATDVYSLGVMLFEMLTGKTPYTGAFSVVAGQILTAPVPPVQEFRPDVHSRLDAVCRKAMAKEPADRYASMAEYADALGKYLKAPVASPPPLPVPPAAAVAQAPSPAVGRSPFDDLEDAAPAKPALEKPKKGQDLTARLARRKWPIIAGAAVCLLLAGVVILWAAGAFRLKTQDGTIVLENLPTDAEVFVDGAKVSLQLKGDDGPIEIQAAPGKRKLEIKMAGFKLETQDVTLTSGERKPIGIRLEPLAAAPVVAVPAKTELPPRYKNTLGMEFALVPKGKAWLGGGGGKPGDKEVEFKHDFYLGVYDVTQGEWQQIQGTNPSCFRPGGSMAERVKDVPEADLKRFPVENISWPDSQVFLAALNKREPANGWTYRLPTEAEWEYACRGGPMADRAVGASDFYFDKPTLELLPTQANFKHPGCMQRTCKVGSYSPNGLGLYDMHGNVIEWCADEWFGTGHRYRGGCWSDGAERCRAGFVFGNGDPGAHDNYLGMRVARISTDQDRADGAPWPAKTAPAPEQPIPMPPADAAAAFRAGKRMDGDANLPQRRMGRQNRVLRTACVGA